MAHDHAHPKNATYFLDQLCTVATCGLVGMIAILMYRPSGPLGQSKLSYILAPQFFIYVLLGGITIVGLVIVRAITLWQQAKEVRSSTCNHDHVHDHPHTHDHGHEHHHHDHDHNHGHAHSHDHAHDHGWTPARYAVLMLPIMLYFFNLPNSSFSAEYINRDLDKAELVASTGAVADRGMKLDLGFSELTKAAFYAQQREELEGKTGKLRGMFSRRRSDKEFTLYRVKINCCAADAIPVGVVIVSDENITQVKDGTWVEVEGQIQFLKEVGKDKFTPVMRLKSRDQVVKLKSPPSSDYGLD